MVSSVCAALCSVALAVTLLLTVFRLGDPHTKYGVLLATLAPFGTLTDALALLFTLPILLSAGRIRRLAAAACVLALVLLATHLAWLAPLHLGDHARAAGTGRVVLMSQNFESGDAAELGQRLREERVDVLVIVDVGPAQTIAARRAATRAGLRFEAPGGKSLVFSRYPTTAVTDISHGGSSRVVRIAGTPIGDLTVLAVHPTPAYQAPKWALDHERIRRYLNAEPTNRTIIAGDLNATLDNAPLRRLQAAGFTDAAVQVKAGWSPTWPSGGSRRYLGVGVPPVLTLDHVLTSADLAVTRLRTLPLSGADHDGLLATIGPRVRANN